MNKIINKLLLIEDKFLPELHFRQLEFTYTACAPFTKHERFKLLEKQVILNISIRTSHYLSYFALDAEYCDSKDLAQRPTSDKILKNRAYKFAKNYKYDGYHRGLASKFYKFFLKKQGQELQAKISKI